MGAEPTTAAQVMITVIPMVGIVMGSVIIFFFLLWRHRQRMELIRQGKKPDDTLDVRSFSLLAGLIAAAVGFVLTVFILFKDGASYSLLGGLIPLSVGLSLLAFYVLRENERHR
ncbi:MAG: DUF6249 domain-containing protein [Spirochaetota bacterium]